MISNEEQRQAQRFAEDIDELVARGRVPAASDQDTDLLRAAASLRSTLRDDEAYADLYDGAIEAAVARRSGAVTPWWRGRLRSPMSWALAAAVVVLIAWLTTHRPPMIATAPTLDEIVGPIPIEQAGDASDRAQQMYAARVAAYEIRRQR